MDVRIWFEIEKGRVKKIRLGKSFNEWDCLSERFNGRFSNFISDSVNKLKINY